MECTLVAALSENLKIQLRLSNIFIKTKVRFQSTEPLVANETETTDTNVNR